MKTINLLVAAAAVITMSSCGNSEVPAEETEIAVDMKSMSVNTEASSLSWKGMKNAEDFHTGTVSFKEGSAQFVDGNLASGTFLVDMNSITVTDVELPDGKKDYLKSHLSSPDFFNTEAHAQVEVTVGQIEAGKAPVTLNIMGQKMEQILPLTVSMVDGSASISGKFDVDFSALDRPGFQVKEGETEHILPTISFELNLQLK
jgi:polyisoprenoid-binding protein YceI